MFLNFLQFKEKQRVSKVPRFWDITPCSPLKVNQRFGGTCRLHLQGRKIRQSKKQHEACSKQSETFNGLHSSITTAVRTSNPKKCFI
jgi:hypothetical protein